MLRKRLTFLLAAAAAIVHAQTPATETAIVSVTVTIDRGEDVGQNFGSLFEVKSSDGSFILGAGFQNAYNTRYRADRHAIQFFVRPTAGDRSLTAEPLPRPNDLCGTYLFSRDDTVFSTYGGVKAWSPDNSTWSRIPDSGGTNETMRLGTEMLTFGDSTVTYSNRTVLSPPEAGSYQLFFYANGHLCFYHVHRREGAYRPWTDDADGFSKLYACPWTPTEATVDLSKAVILTLPVVGETTFAWGQLGEQIVTGSNIGGFYVFEENAWRMLLAPEIDVSYQLYSTMSFHDRLLMGQYPTGHIFEYDGKRIRDIPGWPPKLEGVSASAREAQTTVIYGGDVFVGVWPWGELWRYNPDSRNWAFARRMFDHPALTDQMVHPYELDNSNGTVANLWGQRVTSLVTNGPDLFVSTSAKAPCEWDAERYPFLAPDKWKSYGAVYQLTMPGHLGATTQWTEGPTTFTFTITDSMLTIHQDGTRLASTTLPHAMRQELNAAAKLQKVNWGTGIYGDFCGNTISGSVE